MFIKDDAKKRHPCWRVCAPPAHARPSLWAPADKASLHRRANGHLKVTDSSGPGPAWVTDFMSSATALTYSRKCISLPPRQGDSSHSPCLKCFPTWQVEPSSPVCHSLKSTGPTATCHSFLVTTGQSPPNISAYIIAATLWLQASSCLWTLCVFMHQQSWD